MTKEAFLCKKDVQNLILKFELQGVTLRRDGMMGTEQSALRPHENPRMAHTKNLVKQRISQFDSAEIETLDKRTRHRSTSDNVKPSVTDFHRSKSYDYTRREKDRYVRSRQLTPKIHNEPFKFETPNSHKNRETSKTTVTSPERNINKSEHKTENKKSHKRTEQKGDKNESNKNIQKHIKRTLEKENESNNRLPKQLSRESSCSSASSKLSKSISRASTSSSSLTVKTDSEIHQNETHAGESEDDMFEVIPAFQTSKIIRKDTLHIKGNTFPKINKKKVRPIKSVTEVFENSDTEPQLAGNYSCVTDNDDNLSKTKNSKVPHWSSNDEVQALENVLKDIDNSLKGTTVTSKENSISTENEDEATIEIRLKEMEETIKEIKTHHNRKNVDEDVSLTCHKEQEGDSASHPKGADVEDMFEQRSFGSIEGINFAEAYNRSGDELVITSVAAVEHRLSSEGQNEEYTSNINHSLELANHLSENTIYEEITLENNVAIRSHSSGGFERTIKTETIYDSQNNPRIARVSNVSSEEQAKKAKAPEDQHSSKILNNPKGRKAKKDFIIEELIDTEHKYIKHLERVVWDYMPVLTDEKLPPALIGKSQYLFGNIRKIYSTTQRFYRALRNSPNDHEEIAKTFLNYKHLFELYAHYSKNKKMADQYLLGDFREVISAREKALNDRLGLASYLLTPIQRLGKYILFLQQIQKELAKNGNSPSENIDSAMEMVRKQMSRGNDYLAIDSIKECPISLLEQGSCVLSGKFTVLKPRKFEATLFLFEEILVFTTVDPRDPEKFIYRDSIKLNEMGIVVYDDQSLGFLLKRFPTYKRYHKEQHEFMIQAKRIKEKKTWTEEIEKRLWEQLRQCKDKQKEEYINQGKRDSVVELPEKPKAKKSESSSSLEEKKVSLEDLPDRSKRRKPGYQSLPYEMRKNSSKFFY